MTTGAIQCPDCGRWFQDDRDDFWASHLYDQHQERDHWTGMLFTLDPMSSEKVA